jgi:hypothetical protein
MLVVEVMACGAALPPSVVRLMLASVGCVCGGDNRTGELFSYVELGGAGAASERKG